MVFGLVSAQAGRGLIELEPSPEERLTYLDFVGIYADLDDHERQLYTQRYPHGEGEVRPGAGDGGEVPSLALGPDFPAGTTGGGVTTGRSIG